MEAKRQIDKCNCRRARNVRKDDGERKPLRNIMIRPFELVKNIANGNLKLVQKTNETNYSTGEEEKVIK